MILKYENKHINCYVKDKQRKGTQNGQQHTFLHNIYNVNSMVITEKSRLNP